MNKRAQIVIMLIFLVVVSIATISIIEFYYAKDRDRMPLMAIKNEDKSKQYIKYSSLFYKVYKCYSGNVFVVGINADEVYCPRIAKYDENDNYTTYNGLTITKKNYQMIYGISNSPSEIENFTLTKEIEDSVLVANEYQRSIYKFLKTENGVSIVVFREFEISNIYGDYDWIYQELNEEYYKCEKDGLFKEYENGQCVGEWKKYEFSSQWCSLAAQSTMSDIKNTYNLYCQ